MIDFLLLLSAIVIIAGTLLPILRHQGWWVRVFDFPRLILAVLSVLTAAAALWLWNGPSWLGNSLVLLLAGCLALHLWKIFPYTPLSRTEVHDAGESQDRSEIRLLVANVLMDNRHVDGFLDLTRRFEPDMVLILEADTWWADHLAPLHRRYAHRMEMPLENTYGMLLYSKWELLDRRILFLVEDDVPSFHARVRTDDGLLFDFRGVHPRPPRPMKARGTKKRDAELIMIGKQVSGRELPTIVAGDLNDVAWSHTTRLFQKVSGLLDPRRGRGLYNTFHAKVPLLRWPLDHVFHSPHFALKEIKLLPASGSDHFPFFIVFAYEPGRMPPPPEPDAEEHREADEKLDHSKG
jgi:endonuclease/exonuclease/phosphatase (EEP) superfamily protein YafD